MKFAIGTPGQRVRTVAVASSAEAVSALQRPGEVVFECNKDVTGIIAADGSGLVAEQTPFTILAARKAGVIIREFGSRITTGLAWQGEQIALDDGSRANLTGMAVTASMVAAGGATWPDSYARGWVAVSGARVPLPEPADGTALALAAAEWYSRLVQHEQDLLDAVAAATDAAGLDAIDPSAGWPT